MDRGQRAIAILSMLSSAAKALEEDADVEHVLCVYLTGALGADVGVCFAPQPDGGAEPITTHPRGPAAAGLIERLPEVVDGVPDDAPVLIDERSPRPGARAGAARCDRAAARASSALAAWPSPATTASPRPTWRCSGRPCPCSWPCCRTSIAASQRRQRAEAGQQAAGEFGLTARELEVLELLAQGLLATSIASRLSLSPRTVHKHLGNIYDKLGVHDRLVAVSLARSRYLVPDPVA